MLNILQTRQKQNQNSNWINSIPLSSFQIISFSKLFPFLLLKLRKPFQLGTSHKPILWWWNSHQHTKFVSSIRNKESSSGHKNSLLKVIRAIHVCDPTNISHKVRHFTAKENLGEQTTWESVLFHKVPAYILGAPDWFDKAHTKFIIFNYRIKTNFGLCDFKNLLRPRLFFGFFNPFVFHVALSC